MMVGGDLRVQRFLNHIVVATCECKCVREAVHELLICNLTPLRLDDSFRVLPNLDLMIFLLWDKIVKMSTSSSDFVVLILSESNVNSTYDINNNIYYNNTAYDSFYIIIR